MGIQPDPSPSPPQGQQATPPRGPVCPPQASEESQKSSVRTATPSRTRASKNTATSSPPFCAWCAATCWSCEKKTVAFSEDDPVFSEGDPVFPRWKLSKPPQSRTNTPQAKPSLLALEPRQSSLA